MERSLEIYGDGQLRSVVLTELQGFIVEPWRSIVERTFAWLENSRRLCRDYEELPEHHESFVYVTMIRLRLRQLTHNLRTR